MMNDSCMKELRNVETVFLKLLKYSVIFLNATFFFIIPSCNLACSVFDW